VVKIAKREMLVGSIMGKSYIEENVTDVITCKKMGKKLMLIEVIALV
jgi:hypothetical protein